MDYNFTMLKKRKFIFFFFIIFLIIVVYFINKSFPITQSGKSANAPTSKQEATKEKISPFKVGKSIIIFGERVIATKEKQPYLFFHDFNGDGENRFYTYSYVDDLLNEGGSSPLFGFTPITQFIRIDKMNLHLNTYAYESTIFYEPQSGAVLFSPEKQNSARYPVTMIESQAPLTIRFIYDITRPIDCYGITCRLMWSDFFKWNGTEKKFNKVNSEYKGDYESIYTNWMTLNEEGCIKYENMTLEQVHALNDTAHCEGSTREDLDTFIELKQDILDIVGN